MVVQKKKTQESEGKEGDQENKRRDEKMKEKLDERKTQKCFFERDSVLKNTGEAKKDQKREIKFSTFFEKEKKKKRSFQKEQNYVFVRMQGLFEKKHYQKRIVKHFRKCFKGHGEI